MNGALAIEGLAVLALAAVGLAGASRALWRRLHRTSPADAQAIQDADNDSVALTHDTHWQELETGFAADIAAYRGGLGMPGEHRTTWTREDYTS
jgi:hypothetical protein